MTKNIGMTDYKYRKLRKIVKTAPVAVAVKNLLFCTLNDYKKNRSIPLEGDFESGKYRCAIGAAVHNVDIYKKMESKCIGAWEDAAQDAFGVTANQCTNIIAGFDGDKFGGKVQKLAYTLRTELGIVSEDNDEDDYDDGYDY